MTFLRKYTNILSHHRRVMVKHRSCKYSELGEVFEPSMLGEIGVRASMLGA